MVAGQISNWVIVGRLNITYAQLQGYPIAYLPNYPITFTLLSLTPYLKMAINMVSALFS